MHRRCLLLICLLTFAIAFPLAASQFISQPFDEVARDAKLVVRGTVERTWTAWNDDHDMIFTYAQVRVHRYFGETTGPDLVIVREVGGVVDGYAQEAIGFPAIREDEQVVLLLSQWDNSSDYRIHAFNQGKFLVQNRGGVEVLTEDPVKQGDARLGRPTKFDMNTEATGLTLDEFAEMIDAARAGEPFERKPLNRN